MIIQHVEQPELPSVVQVVVHEVHRPDLIDRARNRQGLRDVSDQPTLGLNPQVQLQEPINAVYALVVPNEPFNVAQEQVAQAEAPIALVVCQTYKPVGDLFVFTR